MVFILGILTVILFNSGEDEASLDCGRTGEALVGEGTGEVVGEALEGEAIGEVIGDTLEGERSGEVIGLEGDVIREGTGEAIGETLEGEGTGEEMGESNLDALVGDVERVGNTFIGELEGESLGGGESEKGFSRISFLISTSSISTLFLSGLVGMASNGENPRSVGDGDGRWNRSSLIFSSSSGVVTSSTGALAFSFFSSTIFPSFNNFLCRVLRVFLTESTLFGLTPLSVLI